MKLLLSAAPLLFARPAWACAVCFGAADGQSGLSRGLWWGLVVLISVTMSLVAGIGWAVWTVERRRARRNA